MLKELTAEASFTRIEEEVRRFWRRHGVPEAFRAAHHDGPSYVIYQQPLATVGQPQADQVRLLATADLLARYRAMQGDAVQRQIGWGCHGLPVEVAVERSLGLKVAKHDLARFNTACQDAAVEGVGHGEALAERLAVWLDPSDTYATLRPQAIGVVWGALRQLWDAGRLKHERRVVSVCPRCATPLSAMEVSRRAVQADARAVWLRLPWDGEPDAYFLVWTHVPWTLVGMVALAVHPEAGYILVEVAEHEGCPASRLLLAETALSHTLTGEYRLVRRLTGKSLRGARYRPLFTFLPVGEGACRVVLSQDVPLDRGTGLFPVTPAFEALSLAMAQAHSLPVPQLLDDRGSLGDTVTSWRGLSPLDAESLLVEDLQARGLLFRKQTEVRPRPLCPYCETPLLPQARDVWLVETASGPWIVGRDRAWGVPLPVWVCERCQESVCVAGLDDLAHRTGLDAGQIDPHRPAVDRLTFPCETCGGTMRRVVPVVDAAFEAAVLPWATVPQPSPADLAVGLGDRHLGWLGDLTEAAALLRGSLAWERAVALPEGEAGVALDLERTFPADALRWAAYTHTTPAQAERSFLRRLWRLVVSSFPSPPPERQEEGGGAELLDHWLPARLHQAISAVTEALDTCDPQRAAGELAALVDDISAWYVPHRPGGGRKTLGILCRLLAPFGPHLAEAIHRQEGRKGMDSVHMAAWPSPDPAWEDQALLAQMAQVRRLAALGQAARLQAGIELDRPLPEAFIDLLGEDESLMALVPFRDLLAEVLVVAQVQFTLEARTQVEWRLALNAEQAVERGIAPAEIEAALANLGPGEAADVASQIAAGLSVGLDVGKQTVTLLPDEVNIFVQAHPGWAAAAEAGHLVALEVG